MKLQAAGRTPIVISPEASEIPPATSRPDESVAGTPEAAGRQDPMEAASSRQAQW